MHSLNRTRTRTRTRTIAFVHNPERVFQKHFNFPTFGRSTSVPRMIAWPFKCINCPHWTLFLIEQHLHSVGGRLPTYLLISNVSLKFSHFKKDIWRKPWSSGCGKWLMFWRLRVWIPAPVYWIDGDFFTFICYKNCFAVCLKRHKVNKKEAGGMEIWNGSIVSNVTIIKGRAQWIHLHLSSYIPGFKSKGHHTCFIWLIANLHSLFFYICHWMMKRIKIKRGRVWPAI